MEVFSFIGLQIPSRLHWKGSGICNWSSLWQYILIQWIPPILRLKTVHNLVSFSPPSTASLHPWCGVSDRCCCFICFSRSDASHYPCEKVWSYGCYQHQRCSGFMSASFLFSPEYGLQTRATILSFMAQSGESNLSRWKAAKRNQWGFSYSAVSLGQSP